MRVLVLSDLWPPFPGGAERLAFNLGRYFMLDRGHDVLALTGYEYPQAFDGPPVMRADISLDPAGWSMIADVLEGWLPDVIVTHHLYARCFAEQLARTRIPLVQVVLNGPRLPWAALAVYITKWVRDQAGVVQPQDLVLRPPAFPDVVADRHGDAIGFIKPIEHKGVELVYRLAEALPRRRFVVLRGEWQNLEVLTDLPNVEFMQPVADIRDFYAECGLVLVPSRSEDAGTVAQEATLNGLPVVASNVDGLRETADGAVLLAPDDTRRWLRAIQRLNDPRWARRVVAQQQKALAAYDYPGRLAQLAERVEALAWTRR